MPALVGTLCAFHFNLSASPDGLIKESSRNDAFPIMTFLKLAGGPRGEKETNDQEQQSRQIVHVLIYLLLSFRCIPHHDSLLNAMSATQPRIPLIGPSPPVRTINLNDDPMPGVRILDPVVAQALQSDWQPQLTVPADIQLYVIKMFIWESHRFSLSSRTRLEEAVEELEKACIQGLALCQRSPHLRRIAPFGSWALVYGQLRLVVTLHGPAEIYLNENGDWNPKGTCHWSEVLSTSIDLMQVDLWFSHPSRPSGIQRQVGLADLYTFSKTCFKLPALTEYDDDIHKGSFMKKKDAEVMRTLSLSTTRKRHRDTVEDNNGGKRSRTGLEAWTERLPREGEMAESVGANVGGVSDDDKTEILSRVEGMID